MAKKNTNEDAGGPSGVKVDENAKAETTDAKVETKTEKKPKTKAEPKPVKPPTAAPVVVGETFGAGMTIQLTDEQFEKLSVLLVDKIAETMVHAFVEKAGDAAREIIEPIVNDIRDSVSDNRDAMLQLQLDLNMLKVAAGARDGATRDKPAAVKTTAPKAPTNGKLLFKQKYKDTADVRADYQKKFKKEIDEWREKGKGKEWLDKEKNHDNTPDYFGKESELVWEKMDAAEQKRWKDDYKKQAQAPAPVENNEE